MTSILVTIINILVLMLIYMIVIYRRQEKIFMRYKLLMLQWQLDLNTFLNSHQQSSDFQAWSEEFNE